MGRKTRQDKVSGPNAGAFDQDTLSYFKRLAITVGSDGVPRPTQATYSLLQIERLRQASQTRIPAAPKYLFPDAMGKGVTRSAWGEPLTDKHLRQYGRKAPVAVKSRYACVSQVSSGCEILPGNKRNQDGSQTGLKVVHKDHFRDEPAPKGFEKYIKRAEDMLDTPFRGDVSAPPVLSFQTLVQGVYGDVFDLNRGVIEPIRRGGEVVGLRPADGGILIPAWDVVRRWTGYYGTKTKDGRDIEKLDPATRADAVSADIRSRMEAEGYRDPGVDLSDMDLEWVIYRDGIIDGGFKRGELIVLPMLTSTDINYAGHPPSYLQLGMEFVALSWTIHDFNGRKFTDAAWNSMILAVIGEGYDEQGFNEFLNNYRVAVKGYQRANKPAIIHVADGGDIKTIDTRPPVSDAEFRGLNETCESGFCAILRRHPEIINGVTPQSGGPRLTGPSEDMRIRISREEGQVNDVRHMALYASEFVRMAVHDDLRVIAVFPSADRGAIIDVVNKEVTNLRTVNEGRVEQGLEPIGFYLPIAEYNVASDEDKKRWLENPFNYPTNPNFLKTLQFTMGLNKGASDAQQPPSEPKLGPDGKLIPEKAAPMTFDHAPGMSGGQPDASEAGGAANPDAADGAAPPTE